MRSSMTELFSGHAVEHEVYVAAALHVFLPCLDGGVVGQVLGRRHVVAVIQLPVGKDVDTGGGDIDVAPFITTSPLSRR